MKRHIINADLASAVLTYLMNQPIYRMNEVLPMINGLNALPVLDEMVEPEPKPPLPPPDELTGK